MLESIQQAVKPHDRYQIEIKHDYELTGTHPTHYTIDTYIFIPRTLGITPETYSARGFYRNTQTYIRLKTPTFNLRELLESERSPLSKIEALIAEPDWVASENIHTVLIAQLNLLGAIFKSAIRNHLQLIEQRIAEMSAIENGKPHHMIDNLVQAFLTQTEQVSQRFRSLFTQFNFPNIPQAVYEAYLLTDEFVSILIEEKCAAVFQMIEGFLKKSAYQAYQQRLSKRFEAETKYRKSRGYPSILSIDSDNEAYIYRASILKQFTSSILFLDTEVTKDGWQWEQVAHAIAAGISMVFATLLAFYFQSRFGNLTFPFFIALVIGYMLKDRIKETGRKVFGTLLKARLYDRRVIIRTKNQQQKLGVLLEKAHFIDENAVPISVLQERNRDRFAVHSNDNRGEYVICHRKVIKLDPKAIEQAFPTLPNITGVNDIFRLDVRDYLNKMAEPIQTRIMLHKDDLVQIACRKVYYVNLVMRYRSAEPRTGKMRRHLRLVLDQTGICRVE